MTSTYPHTDTPGCICEACTGARHDLQNSINLDSLGDIEIPASLRNGIEEHAAEAHAAYEQYAGHWTEQKGWVLVEITQTITTKLGEAFAKGDIAIAQHRPGMGLYGGRWTAYSIRNGIDTDIGSAAREIPAWDLIQADRATGRTRTLSVHTTRHGAERAYRDIPGNPAHVWRSIQPRMTFETS